VSVEEEEVKFEKVISIWLCWLDVSVAVIEMTSGATGSASAVTADTTLVTAEYGTSE